MDAPRIAGFQPGLGVGSLKNNQERRRNGRSFEDDLEQGKKRRKPKTEDVVELEAEASVGSDNSGAGTGAGPITLGLQDREGSVRKDEEDDGLLHIDVIV